MAGGAIKAVLFDSGDTLLRPIGGTWWPRPVLLRLLQRSGLEVTAQRLDAAHEPGVRFLDSHHRLSTEEEEVAQFREFYAVVLRELGIRTEPATIEELAIAEVRELIQEPFPETREVLEELHGRGLRLGIVSNAWPSLDRTYRILGLRDFFSAFIVSAHLGYIKPDLRIFRAATEAIGVPPAETLFIDDVTEHVLAAQSLGMCGVVISRDRAENPAARAIRSLAEVKSIV